MSHIGFAHHDPFVHGSLCQCHICRVAEINEFSSIPLLLLRWINESNVLKGKEVLIFVRLPQLVLKFGAGYAFSMYPTSSGQIS